MLDKHAHRLSLRRTWYQRNKAKVLKQVKQWKKANPNYDKDWIRQKRYGLAPEQYQQLLQVQNNQCAICKIDLTTAIKHIDHHHELNHIRGILCHKCNMGLGLFQENPTLLDAAKTYLMRELEHV